MNLDKLLSSYSILTAEFDKEERNVSIIRSNLMLKCLYMAEEENSTLDIRSTCCRWCLNPLSPKCCSVMLKPQKRPKKHLRSLLRKDKETLNRFQKKLVEKITSKPASNYLTFKCNFCSRTTLTSVKKPIAESKNKNEEILTDDHGRKKKKKRRDIYAGLNIAAVESVKNISVNANTYTERKKDKKLTVKEQSRMQRALSQKASVTVPKKKPSLLSAFLDSM